MGSQREQSLSLFEQTPLFSRPSMQEKNPMSLKPRGFLTRPYVLLTEKTDCEGGFGLKMH